MNRAVLRAVLKISTYVLVLKSDGCLSGKLFNRGPQNP